MRAIEHRQPELLHQFRCLSRRRGLVQDSLKLIEIEDRVDELFDLETDPLELLSLVEQRPQDVQRLERHLRRVATLMERQRDITPAGATLEVEGDDTLLQRLRGLGYIE